MMLYATEMFLVSLLLTIIVEVAAALIFKVRRPKELVLVILVNILTNPAAVWLAWLRRFYFIEFNRTVFAALLEISVIFCEAWIYKKYIQGTRRPFILSAAANICSFSCGWFLHSMIL